MPRCPAASARAPAAPRVGKGPVAERRDRLGRVALPARRGDDRVADHHGAVAGRTDEADLPDHDPVLQADDEREAPALVPVTDEEAEPVVGVGQRVAVVEPHPRQHPAAANRSRLLLCHWRSTRRRVVSSNTIARCNDQRPCPAEPERPGVEACGSSQPLEPTAPGGDYGKLQRPRCGHREDCDRAPPGDQAGRRGGLPGNGDPLDPHAGSRHPEHGPAAHERKAVPSGDHVGFKPRSADDDRSRRVAPCKPSRSPGRQARPGAVTIWPNDESALSALTRIRVPLMKSSVIPRLSPYGVTRSS